MRHDKTLPPFIEIGYWKLKLESHEYDDAFHEVYGQYEQKNKKLVICITGDPTTDANTMIHEIMHVIYAQYLLSEVVAQGSRKKTSDMVREGDKEIAEERIVNSMANGMTEMSMRNPRIAEWLWERLNG